MQPYPGQDNSLLDVISILSLVLGVENLQENRAQSKHNDVQAANDKQAKFLLEEITRQFEEQNKILADQNAMLEQLLQKLNELNGGA